MKLFACLGLVLLAVACGPDSGPPPVVTPGPVPEPCKRFGVGASGVIYKGDCVATKDCVRQPDGTYIGTGEGCLPMPPDGR